MRVEEGDDAAAGVHRCRLVEADVPIPKHLEPEALLVVHERVAGVGIFFNVVRDESVLESLLKLIGDGTLAIFTAEDRMHACSAALSAAIAARRAVAELKKRRAAAGKPVTDMYLGLHVGEVVYGNVGSRERLDFTVIGPAVNEASRIAAMCRSIDQPVLISASFAEVGDIRRRLVSVGRYALRGVSHPQELFTLDPEALAGA